MTILGFRFSKWVIVYIIVPIVLASIGIFKINFNDSPSAEVHPQQINNTIVQLGSDTSTNTISEEKNTSSAIYPGSIYDLNEALSLLPSSFDRADSLKRYIGLTVKAEGLRDNFDVYNNQIYVIFESKAKPLGDFHEFQYQVGCYFDKGWQKVILDTDYHKALSFTGTIHSYGLFLILDNCVIN